MTWTKSTQSPTAWQRTKLAVAAGAALIGVTGGGTLQAKIDSHDASISSHATTIALHTTELDDLGVSVTQYGGVMNNSGASVRTANSAALLAAAAASVRVKIPPGTLWIDPGIEVPAGLQLSGAGRQVTTIKGDGDLLKFTTASFGIPEFSDFTLANDVTRGKLVRTATGVDMGRVGWRNVDFGKSTHHLYTTDVIVNWEWRSCYFTDASVTSRLIYGMWACREFDCYTWFNASAGLVVRGGASSSNSSHGSVYEQNGGNAVIIDASAGDILSWKFLDCHFEANGANAGGAFADVLVMTSGAYKVRGVTFSGGGFYLPVTGQVQRVEVTAGGGGNIDKILFTGGFAVVGAVALCSASYSAVTIDSSVYFQTGSVGASNYLPISLPSASGKLLGFQTVTGVSGGNLQQQASLAIPSGTKLAIVIVQGRFYNGADNTHDGHFEGRYVASGNRTHTVLDVNNSSGSAQGFTLAYSAGSLVTANKTGLTNTQSGDTTFLFFG